MTVYTSDTHNGDQLYFLWADDVDELVMMAAVVGADPLAMIQRNPSCWAHYLLTVDQWAEALVQGVTLTDRYGPAEWMNRRAGNWAFVAKLQQVRAYYAGQPSGCPCSICAAGGTHGRP